MALMLFLGFGGVGWGFGCGAILFVPNYIHIYYNVE